MELVKKDERDADTKEFLAQNENCPFCGGGYYSKISTNDGIYWIHENNKNVQPGCVLHDFHINESHLGYWNERLW